MVGIRKPNTAKAVKTYAPILGRTDIDRKPDRKPTAGNFKLVTDAAHAHVRVAVAGVLQPDLPYHLRDRCTRQDLLLAALSQDALAEEARLHIDVVAKYLPKAVSRYMDKGFSALMMTGADNDYTRIAHRMAQYQRGVDDLLSTPYAWAWEPDVSYSPPLGRIGRGARGKAMLMDVVSERADRLRRRELWREEVGEDEYAERTHVLQSFSAMPNPTLRATTRGRLDFGRAFNGFEQSKLYIAPWLNNIPTLEECQSACYLVAGALVLRDDLPVHVNPTHDGDSNYPFRLRFRDVVTIGGNVFMAWRVWSYLTYGNPICLPHKKGNYSAHSSQWVNNLFKKDDWLLRHRTIVNPPADFDYRLADEYMNDDVFPNVGEYDDNDDNPTDEMDI